MKTVLQRLKESSSGLGVFTIFIIVCVGFQVGITQFDGIPRVMQLFLCLVFGIIEFWYLCCVISIINGKRKFIKVGENSYKFVKVNEENAEKEKIETAYEEGIEQVETIQTKIGKILGSIIKFFIYITLILLFIAPSSIQILGVIMFLMSMLLIVKVILMSVARLNSVNQNKQEIINIPHEDVIDENILETKEKQDVAQYIMFCTVCGGIIEKGETKCSCCNTEVKQML